jgi:hypothetical protein
VKDRRRLVDNIKVNVVIFTLDALRTRNLTNISWILEKFEDNSLLGYCVVLSQKSVNILPLNVCELLEDSWCNIPEVCHLHTRRQVREYFLQLLFTGVQKQSVKWCVTDKISSLFNSEIVVLLYSGP